MHQAMIEKYITFQLKVKMKRKRFIHSYILCYRFCDSSAETKIINVNKTHFQILNLN